MAVAVLKPGDAGLVFTNGTATWQTSGSDTNMVGPRRYLPCSGTGTPGGYVNATFGGYTAGDVVLLAISYDSVSATRQRDQTFKVYDANDNLLGTIVANAQDGPFDEFNWPGTVAAGTPKGFWLGEYTIPSGTTSIRVYTDNAGADATKFCIADGFLCRPKADAYTPVYAPRVTRSGACNLTDRLSWATGDKPASTSAWSYKTQSPVFGIVDSAATWGPSLSAGNAAITVTLGSTLHVPDGVLLTLTGDIALSDPRTTRVSGYFPVTVGTGTNGGGAAIEFDGTASTAKYRIRPTVDLMANAYIKMRGVSGNNAVIRSKSGSPNAWIDYNANRGLAIDAEHAALLRIGDATNPSLSIYPSLAAPSTLTDCTLDACGQIAPGGSTHYVTYTRVTMINTVASRSMTTGSGGLTTIADCRFDKRVDLYGPPTASITGSYFGDGKTLVSPFTVSTYSDNLINCYSDNAALRTVADSYYFYDIGGDSNPHPHVIASGGNGSVTGCIFDCPVGTVGDMIVGGAGSGNTTTVSGCIVLPNAAGTSPGELASPIVAGLWSVNHNTVCSTDAQGTAAESGVAVYGETYAGLASMYASLRSNIAWTPSGKGAFLLRHILSTVSDVVANSGGNILADYNCCNDPVTATGSGVVAVYGASGGYCDTTVAPSVAMFTSTTGLGVNDIVANPNFVDTARNVATFDSAYLGNSATAWTNGASYSVGDFVSVSDPALYGGSTVNFRCKVAHTSVSGNTSTGKPGTVASWRTNWEWASIYRLRTTAVTYNASIPQATPKDLRLWVKAGWAPTNVALHNTAHDGGDIGAVAWTAAASGARIPASIFEGGFQTMVGGYNG